MKVEFLEEAREEFLAAVDFYESQADGLGHGLIVEVERALARLAEAPEIGARFSEARRLPLSKYPYHIIYERNGERLTVVAIAHQRRKPGYWRDRG